VTIYARAKWKILKTQSHSNAVLAVAFSPDEKFLAVGDAGNCLTLHSTNKLLQNTA